MITKQPTTMTPARKKIPNYKLKEIVSYMVDTPTTEWQNDKTINIVNCDNESTSPKLTNSHEKYAKRMYGMSLYCEACRKYDVKPTDCVGKVIDDVKFNKWLNRSHKLSYNYHYREEYLKPMMYKLNKL